MVLRSTKEMYQFNHHESHHLISISALTFRCVAILHPLSVALSVLACLTIARSPSTLVNRTLIYLSHDRAGTTLCIYSRAYIR